MVLKQSDDLPNLFMYGSMGTNQLGQIDPYPTFNGVMGNLNSINTTNYISLVDYCSGTPTVFEGSLRECPGVGLGLCIDYFTTTINNPWTNNSGSTGGTLVKISNEDDTGIPFPDPNCAFPGPSYLFGNEPGNWSTTYYYNMDDYYLNP